MKIDIAQQLVSPESGVTVENFAARAEQIVDPFGLMADFQTAAGETDHKKKSMIGIEVSREAWTEYIEITQWKCVIEYVGSGERLARERKRHYCKRVAIWNRAHFECRLSYYSQCAERSAHQFHQIIPGDVFDHPPAAVNELTAVTYEANPDEQIARSALGKTKRTRMCGADQRAESGQTGFAWINGKALTGAGDGSIQFSDGDSRLCNDCHVVGFVRDDSRQTRHRDAQRDRRAPNSGERAGRADRSQWNSVDFAHADKLANLID
ncbi:MAG TPA: hypothetical protein VK884_10215 [Verrucomicrobiae bacterium]|nr:hypothetical protein [Verrucomicrobiae bacterium]